MSYDLRVTTAAPPSWPALRDAIGLADLRGFPEARADDGAGTAWPEGGLGLYRSGLSTRTTDVDWTDGVVRVSIRALASSVDCELALRVAEAAARLAGATTVAADYFADVSLEELRRLHTADWMHEQAVSGTRVLAALIRDGRGAIDMPGPVRSCFIGPRMLAELEAAGPAEALPERVLETLRRVQWELPAGFREAGVFVSRGDARSNAEGDGKGAGKGEGKGEAKLRPTRFAIWLSDENLLIPCVDYVALRVSEGEIVLVPFSAVVELAGTRGTPFDECQLLIPAIRGEDWAELVARARPLAASPKK